jgi:hypothetical protein
MKEAPGSSETSVLTRATRRNNPEDTILLTLILFSALDRNNIRHKGDVPKTLFLKDAYCGYKENSIAFSLQANYTD